MNEPLHACIRAEVEDFLFREAALLDSWKLDDWLTLLTEDVNYYVPPNDHPEGDRTPPCSSSPTTSCASASADAAQESRTVTPSFRLRARGG